MGLIHNAPPPAPRAAAPRGSEKPTPKGSPVASPPRSRASSNAPLPSPTVSSSAGSAQSGSSASSAAAAAPGPVVLSVGTAKPPRLIVYDVHGKFVHEHHMRPERRHEKLGRMMRDLFKRHEEAAPPPEDDSIDLDAENSVAACDLRQPPSLLSGLVWEMRRRDADPETVLKDLLAQRQSTAASIAAQYGERLSVVGKGSFGVVKLAQKADPQHKNRKLVYAVKEYRPNSGEPEHVFMKRLASEFCLASSLSHVNIIRTLDLLQEGKLRYCGVMEFCAGGDLYSLIVVAGKLEYTEADCFFKQILRGIAYMHEMGVAHRDVKPENVLLTARGCCKLTDFGNSECFRMAWEKEIHQSTLLAGSGPYIAPEEYTKSSFDPRAVDIWACGVVYMAMCSGRQLWQEANQDDEFYQRYLTGRRGKNGYEPIEVLKLEKRRNVIYSVLDPVPSRRLTAKQALNSEWAREIVVCAAGEGRLDMCQEEKEKMRRSLHASLTGFGDTQSAKSAPQSPVEPDSKSKLKAGAKDALTEAKEHARRGAKEDAQLAKQSAQEGIDGAKTGARHARENLHAAKAALEGAPAAEPEKPLTALSKEPLDREVHAKEPLRTLLQDSRQQPKKAHESKPFPPLTEAHLTRSRSR